MWLNLVSWFPLVLFVFDLLSCLLVLHADNGKGVLRDLNSQRDRIAAYHQGKKFKRYIFHPSMKL